MQRARRVEDVLAELFGIISAAHRTFSLLIIGDAIVTDGFQVAELAQRLAPRGVGSHAAGDQALRAHVEVKGQLVVDGLGDLRAAEDETERAAHR